MIKWDLFLAKEWYLAHRALGISADWREFKRIRSIYKSEGRFYHTWQHIYETCLFVRKHYGFQPLVILALVYHDIVYDINSKENEENSAVAWEAYAARRGLNRHTSLKVKQVADMIRMTAKHSVDPNSPLIFLIMSDADMSIFLCPDEHYLMYARNIWREYQSFGRDAYLAGRLHFLSTVDPDTMFYTHQARELVHHARANLDLEKTILENDPDRILV